jgi:glycogen debranching enzyme
VAADRIGFEATLAPQDEATFCLAFRCEAGPHADPIPRFEEAAHEASTEARRRHRDDARIGTSNVHFNDLLDRGVSDLRLMIADTPHGIYPHAGVPWFSTIFGRDGLITALQFLWVKPGLARGVLACLAATQAREDDPERDAEPGKIVHEMRLGEMAALGEIPFGRYYGSADATPLFILLAGAYYRASGDLAFIRALWPHVAAALRWIDEFGDADRDGFVEYFRRSSKGLSSQGWRDSHDAIFHADGSLAEGPIALSEVQAYVYGAWQEAAQLADALEEPGLGTRLREKARALQARFETEFWCEGLSTYAVALDGRKQPCRVRASSAGHALFTGIASPERARRVAATLMSEESFSGWGIRTVAATEARYNPMSYHNGSVWPHDNALIARGFARYGIAQEEVLRLLLALLEASAHSHLHRIPELHCGFRRRMGEGPTLYPVACSPQSWSLGAVFMLLESCLGLTVDALDREVRFVRPVLPEPLERMSIQGLRVGTASVDLFLQRRTRDVEVDVVRRRGDVSVVVVK